MLHEQQRGCGAISRFRQAAIARNQVVATLCRGVISRSSCRADRTGGNTGTMNSCKTSAFALNAATRRHVPHSILVGFGRLIQFHFTAGCLEREAGGDHASPSALNCALLAAPGRLLAETVAAVDRTVAAWQERHFSLLAAVGASSGMHFASPAAVAPAATAGACLGSALGAALGFVLIALLGVVRLVVGAKRERKPAVLTGELLVGVAQDGLLSCGLARVQPSEPRLLGNQGSLGRGKTFTAVSIPPATPPLAFVSAATPFYVIGRLPLSPSPSRTGPALPAPPPPS